MGNASRPAALAVLVLAGCSVSDERNEPTSSSTEAITRSTGDTDAVEANSVVVLSSALPVTPPLDPPAPCSGFLLTPRVVVTMAACISANKFRTEWVVGFGNDAQNFKSTMRSSGVPIVDGSSGIAFVVLSPPTFGSPDLAYELTDAIALPRTPSTANAEGPFVAAWGATLAPTRSIKDLSQIAAVKNDSLSERDEVDLDESS